MKKYFLIIAVFYFAILFIACNPQAGKPAIYEAIKLQATISNTNENINLGDTLKITLKLPDTVVSNLRNIAVQTLQRATFGLSVMKYDTINKRVKNVLSPNVWVTAGSTEGLLSYVLNNNTKPYQVIINVKPIEKGLYRFEVVQKAGTLKFNNIETNLLVGFNVPDYHYDILSIVAPYFGGQPYYDGFVQVNNESFGVYFFRVI
jgi:hypothetical protein